ncbi:MAG TPA: RNA polymerase sigma factor [Methylomirabilota bacterium]|nr:RNA polymerase sigma factor [Methylomirabilota bacterium]
MSANLVQQAQSGDHAAFETIITAAYDRLFGIAYRILRDREAAEDATQDAIVRCWRDLRGLREPDRFEAWLHRLLVNACRDLARRTRRRPEEVYDYPTEPVAAGDDFARLADHDELERAFSRLPTDQRIALVMTHYVGYSAAELATILGIPAGTVSSRLHYGARAMREALAVPSTPSAASEPMR